MIILTYQAVIHHVTLSQRGQGVSKNFMRMASFGWFFHENEGAKTPKNLI